MFGYLTSVRLYKLQKLQVKKEIIKIVNFGFRLLQARFLKNFKIPDSPCA